MPTVRFEVWALGFDKEQMCTDVEALLGTFYDADSAVLLAKAFKTVQDVKANCKLPPLEDGDYLLIQVETIREFDPTNTNICTVYSAEIH